MSPLQQQAHSQQYLQDSSQRRQQLFNQRTIDRKRFGFYFQHSRSSLFSQLTRISDINITMEKNEKIHGEMYQQILNSMATMNESFEKFEYQNDMLRRENADLKTGSENLPKGSDTVALKEQMKMKDFMVANLQKEVTDLKSKRAETTREMNTIREQINHLKAAAKGEKRNPAVESKSQSLTLKFDDFSDKL